MEGSPFSEPVPVGNLAMTSSLALASFSGKKGLDLASDSVLFLFLFLLWPPVLALNFGFLAVVSAPFFLYGKVNKN